MSDTPKSRYGVFLVYPDSAPADWWQRLKDSHGAFARSPLHEPDGENDKPHYHVVYKHSNTVTVDAMKRIIPADVPANGYVELCHAPRNYQRYLVHMDSPEKQQWDCDPRELIDTCNGFPLDLTRDFSQGERVEQRRKIFEIVRDKDLDEYSDLLEGLLDAGLFDLWDYACNHSILFNSYLASRRGRAFRFQRYVGDQEENGGDDDVQDQEQA